MPRKNKRKPLEPPSRDQMAARTHNYCLRMSRAILGQARYIMRTDTLTDESRELVRELANLADRLNTSLKERKS